MVAYFVAGSHRFFPARQALFHRSGHDIEGSFYAILIQQRGTGIHLARTGIVEAEAEGRPLAFRPGESRGIGLRKAAFSCLQEQDEKEKPEEKRACPILTRQVGRHRLFRFHHIKIRALNRAFLLGRNHFAAQQGLPQ